MFLRHRATQAEYFDSPDRSLEEVAEGYRLLARVNRLFHFAEPFQRILPRSLGSTDCVKLSILDVGAGDGSLGSILQEWAATKGWNWSVTSLDANPLALQLTKSHPRVAGSATQLPFRDSAFDVVIASQMTHHLDTEQEVTAHFREAFRVARKRVFLNDIHRNQGLYFVIWNLLRIQRVPRSFYEDGLLSVRRGWRVGEWKSLAREAGMPDARVWLYWGSRIMLLAEKDR
jgi:2-polyprenyl-3-methyl-5-hydroxy-6-metoxy-1,4-benzoquinol methylase